MNTRRFPRVLIGLGAMMVAFAIISSPAGATNHTPAATGCTAPPLSQPFLAWGDSHWYAMPQGERPDSFVGTGWVLTGGARITTTTLATGSSSSVLELPSGATAVRPAICVTSDYPMAKAIVRNVTGYVGVLAYVSYMGTRTWTSPMATGAIRGVNWAWSLSIPMNISPSQRPGWQPMRLTLVGGGTKSVYRLYNLYVDPRMRG